jgi:cytochrome c
MSMITRAGCLLTAAALIVCGFAINATRSYAHSTGDVQDVKVPERGRASRSVLEGIYSAVQAKRGESIYLDQCARCHAETLTGTEFGPAIVGEEFVGAWTGQSVGDLFGRIRESMPLDSPGRLTAGRTVDLVAFILNANEFPSGQSPLSSDPAALKSITIEAHPAGRR